MRTITVAGAAYRWRIRRKPSYSQGLGWTGMVVMVAPALPGGQRLVVELPWLHPGNWLGQPGQAVTPALVAALIERARAAGWSPHQPGSPWLMTMEGGTDPSPG